MFTFLHLQFAHQFHMSTANFGASEAGLYFKCVKLILQKDFSSLEMNNEGIKSSKFTHTTCTTIHVQQAPFWILPRMQEIKQICFTLKKYNLSCICSCL